MQNKTIFTINKFKENCLKVIKILRINVNLAIKNAIDKSLMNCKN